MVDTRNFGSDFVANLIALLPTLDNHVDGVLFHTENFQALSFMQARYFGDVKSVYIDPPYNTGDSEILYRNEYMRSSWLSLMESRLDLGVRLLTEDAVLFIAIDDFEMADLSKLIDDKYSALKREMIIVNHHPQGGKATTLAHTHEYMLACVPRSSARTLIGRATGEGVEERPFKRSGTAVSNFRRGRPNSFYAIVVDPTSKRVVSLEPPPSGADYPTEPTSDGHIRVYPIGASGDERVWRRSFESCQALVANNKLKCSDSMTIYQLLEPHERTAALFSNWVDPRYNAGTFGANLLRDIIGSQNVFSYPKSVHTVEDAISSLGIDDEAKILDFFGGSGTTGHAVINLNREDGERRKFILVEMGEHFETALLPRLKKITYSPEWKDGKPKRLSTDEEIKRGPRVFKVLRLESYEDTLNNLELKEEAERRKLIDNNPGLREDYVLRYMLDVETRGSASLLNIEQFSDPTAYKLKVKKTGSDEYEWKKVDLLETFNYLIGLRVDHMAAPQAFTAEFERPPDPELPQDQHTRLAIKGWADASRRGTFRQDAAGPWWFRKVEGWVPRDFRTPNDGRREKVLIVWRNLPKFIELGPEGMEQDNLMLDAWFEANRISTRDFEYDLIYVNGSNNLPNLLKEGDEWKVRLIEEDFHKRMWDVEDV